MSSYLDKAGLTYVVGKIKTLLGEKVDKENGKGLSTNDYTTAEKTKLSGIATNANNYSHPTTSGYKHIPSGGTSGQFLKWSADGTAVWAADNNTTYSDMKGATASAAGTHGLAPAPTAGTANRYLRSDGTWSVPPDTNTTYTDMTGATTSAAGTHGLAPAPSAGAANRYLRSDGTWVVPPNTTYSNATQSTAGLMSSTDKAKLDGFGAASTYALKSDITGTYKYKGSVDDESKLPTSGQTTGDVYNIVSASSYGAAGMNVAWTGTAWDALGEMFSITEITTAEIDTMFA